MYWVIKTDVADRDSDPRFRFAVMGKAFSIRFADKREAEYEAARLSRMFPGKWVSVELSKLP